MLSNFSLLIIITRLLIKTAQYKVSMLLHICLLQFLSKFNGIWFWKHFINLLTATGIKLVGRQILPSLSVHNNAVSFQRLWKGEHFFIMKNHKNTWMEVQILARELGPWLWRYVRECGIAMGAQTEPRCGRSTSGCVCSKKAESRYTWLEGFWRERISLSPRSYLNPSK